MNKQPPQLDSLLKLLNDEDDIARIAMIQLLHHYGGEIDEILKQLQECGSQLLRKRSHQLQALLTFRERRRHLAKIFHRQDEKFYLSDALIEMHLLWYEKDSLTELTDLYQELLRNYPQNGSDTPEKLALYMRSMQFTAREECSANCDMYMLGSVLDTHCGANSFLCALAMALLEDLGTETEIETILFDRKFYLFDPQSDTLCDPQNHWQIRRLDFTSYKRIDRAQLLKHIGAVCFCNAVHDDAFRYIKILGELLSFSGNTNFLPYPYSGSKDQKNA